MKQEIQDRFDTNLSRVDSLLALYKAVKPNTPGRPATLYSDVLRSAVVFLHASLEDLLRSLEAWRLPRVSADLLPTDGKPRLQLDKKTKFTIADLARHRGRSVDDVIQDSVDVYLAKSNYNDVREVKGVLKLLELDTAIAEPHSTDLAAMMKRRHWIAHRADRNLRIGPGHRLTQAIDAATVQRWLDVVRAFGRDLLSAV